MYSTTSALTWSRDAAPPNDRHTLDSNYNTTTNSLAVTPPWVNATANHQSQSQTSTRSLPSVPPPDRLAALRQLLRSSGTGGSNAFLSGSLDSNNNSSSLWTNEAIDRRDTVATVELRSLRSYHVEPSNAVLEITIVPNHPHQSFPASCIVSVSTNQQRSSDEFANADVVIKEWKLMTTSVSLPRTTLSMSTVMNIASVVRQSSSSSGNQQDHLEDTRVFLTLRFAGCCDMSNRHCIQQVHLVYLVNPSASAETVGVHSSSTAAAFSSAWSQRQEYDVDGNSKGKLMGGGYPQRAALASMMENVVMSPPPPAVKSSAVASLYDAHHNRESTTQAQREQQNDRQRQHHNLNDSVDMHVHVEEPSPAPRGGRPPVPLRTPLSAQQQPYNDPHHQSSMSSATHPSAGRGWSPGQGSAQSSASFLEHRRSVSPRQPQQEFEPSFVTDDIQGSLAAMASHPTHLGAQGLLSSRHRDAADVIMLTPTQSTGGGSRRPRARVRMTTPEKPQHPQQKQQASKKLLGHHQRAPVEEPDVVEIMTSPCVDSAERPNSSHVAPILFHHQQRETALQYNDDVNDDDEDVVVLAISPVVGGGSSRPRSLNQEQQQKQEHHHYGNQATNVRPTNHSALAYEVLLDDEEEDEAAEFEEVDIEASPEQMLTPRKAHHATHRTVTATTTSDPSQQQQATLSSHHDHHQHQDESDMFDYVETSPAPHQQHHAEHLRSGQMVWSPGPSAPPPSFSARLHVAAASSLYDDEEEEQHSAPPSSAAASRPLLAKLVSDVEAQMQQRRQRDQYAVTAALDNDAYEKNVEPQQQKEQQQYVSTVLEVPSRTTPHVTEKTEQQQQPTLRQAPPLPPSISSLSSSTYAIPEHTAVATAAPTPVMDAPSRSLDLQTQVALMLGTEHNGNIDAAKRVAPSSCVPSSAAPAAPQQVAAAYELPPPLPAMTTTHMQVNSSSGMQSAWPSVTEMITSSRSSSTQSGRPAATAATTIAINNNNGAVSSMLSRPVALPSRTSFVSVKHLRSSSSGRGSDDAFSTSDDDDHVFGTSATSAGKWGAPRRPAPILSEDAMAEARRSVTTMENIPQFSQQDDLFSAIGGVLGVEPQAISRPSSRHTSRTSSPTIHHAISTSRSGTPVAAVSMWSQLPSAQTRGSFVSSSTAGGVAPQQQRFTTPPLVFTSSGAGIVALPTSPTHVEQHQQQQQQQQQQYLPPRAPLTSDAAPTTIDSTDEPPANIAAGRFQYEPEPSLPSTTTTVTSSSSSSAPLVLPSQAPLPSLRRRFSIYDEDEEVTVCDDNNSAPPPHHDDGKSSSVSLMKSSEDKGTSLLQAAYKIMVDAVSTTTSTASSSAAREGISDDGKYNSNKMTSMPISHHRTRGGSMVSVPGSISAHQTTHEKFQPLETIPFLAAIPPPPAPAPQSTSLASSISMSQSHHHQLQRSTSWNRSASSSSNTSNSSHDERFVGMHRMIPTKLYAQQPIASGASVGEAVVNPADRWTAQSRVDPRWVPQSSSVALPAPGAHLNSHNHHSHHRLAQANDGFVSSQQQQQQRPGTPSFLVAPSTAASSSISAPPPPPPRGTAAAVHSDVILWCHKHHTSRNGTGRRCLILRPTPDGEGVTFTMKKPDGSSWKGPAVPIQSPQMLIDGGGGLAAASGLGGSDELSNTVLLERTAHITVLYGTDAYNSPSIHQNKVHSAAHCVVVFRKGRLVASLEFDSDHDVRLFLEALSCVLVS
ncbi:Hypothetical protein, putative [Bodo saltans]|uniref:PH-like domain-containing protein n=1 Tax=Bodo saltans TaxID=75058 RepID=A0A0S4JI24_BODSA|nr:Hypothetical protein, putative [Bodo saltans]|eukprot:CUG89800.1 Hypothetical protein, putative [Bodo saltans]